LPGDIRRPIGAVHWSNCDPPNENRAKYPNKAGKPPTANASEKRDDCRYTN